MAVGRKVSLVGGGQDLMSGALWSSSVTHLAHILSRGL